MLVFHQLLGLETPQTDISCKQGFLSPAGRAVALVCHTDSASQWGVRSHWCVSLSGTGGHGQQECLVLPGTVLQATGGKALSPLSC